MSEPAEAKSHEAFGRYLLYPAIARGGMATVHTARLIGAEGFTRLVAAKRLHPQFAEDPDFVTMFHDEACIASRIHHPNVVPVLDVVLSGSELILVQEYVHGVPLAHLMKIASAQNAPIPIDVVIAVLSGILAGLHAAHEVKDELDRPLEIVHRDVSPQNVMVSVDGIPRLLDFGIAKARTSTHHTREGVFKGKLAYMAPEQLRMENIDRAIDIYATGILAWEMLVNRRIHDGRHELAFVTAVMNGGIPSVIEALIENRLEIDETRWALLVELDHIVKVAMSPEQSDRFATASEMMLSLLKVRPAATALAVAAWVRAMGAEYLDQRQRTLAANEESWRRTSVYAPTPSSGAQRALAAGGSAELSNLRELATRDSRDLMVIDTPNPSGFGPIGAANRTSAPPSVTAPSAAPRDESAYRVPPELSSSTLGRIGARLRDSRVLPWLTAGSFVVVLILGGLLRGAADPTPAAGTVLAPASTVANGGLAATTSPGAPPTISPATAPPATQAAALDGQDAMLAPPAVTFVRPTHAAPPPPPRAVWVPRAPAPAAQTPSISVSTAAPAKSDCNPPFYFDGPKKVFKPSCL